MKTIKQIVLLLCASLFIISCTNANKKLEIALKQSGSNRIELEKVISYYTKEKKDSLHLKAAIFLIENMPGHYTPGNSFMTRYIYEIDSLYPNMSNIAKRAVLNIPLQKRSFEKSKRIQDIQVIKSEYLIQHIDNALQMWNNCPWLKDLSFDEFCEYLLPYRIAQEPLLPNDSTLYLWKAVLDTLSYYQYDPNSILEIKSMQRDLLGRSDDDYFHGIQLPSISPTAYEFECLDWCYYELGRLRSVGIPAVIDFVPGWPFRNGKHYWRVMFEPFYRDGRHCDQLTSKTAKVYRMTYSPNPIPASNQKDSIPPIFQNPFLKDVTEQYIKASDINYLLKKVINPAPHHLYLSIFNDLEWRPVAWSAVKQNQTIFHHMGKDIVYLPTYYKGSRIKNAGYPFLFNTKGTIKEFIPNYRKRITLKITRKYPLNDSKVIWGENLKGAYVEASHQADFAQSDTLCKITQTNPDLNFFSITFEKPATYRYWRICKPGQTLLIAEWQLLDTQSQRVTGKAMSGKETDKSFPNAFDNQVLTSTRIAAWVGIDLGKQTEIKTMRFLTRTDDNGITPGHHYELLYYSENGWKTIKEKEATEDYLEFESVPSEALYWLKDLTEGKEERIFSYENGIVRFW